jgi:spore coat polysaccharide biosynthesis protein SpsF (cytidylyltransferase family)
MRVGAVVQARMSSQRLPGKVLAPLAGRPALQWLLERLDHAAELDTVVVATSDDPSDDPVAAFVEERGTALHRGPLDDVATRMLDAARHHELDVVVRVTADAPLLDQRLVDEVVRTLRRTGCDVVTIVRPRTYPKGQSVEAFLTSALAAAHGGATTAEDREHVTGPLYAGGFEVVAVSANPPRTEPAVALDTAEDHARIEALLTGLDRPHWEYGWEEFLTPGRG